MLNKYYILGVKRLLYTCTLVLKDFGDKK